jgi:hypothetical protein
MSQEINIGDGISCTSRASCRIIRIWKCWITEEISYDRDTAKRTHVHCNIITCCQYILAAIWLDKVSGLTGNYSIYDILNAVRTIDSIDLATSLQSDFFDY